MTTRLLASVAKDLAAPIARRLGAVFAALLVARGVPEDLAGQVTMVAGVLAGLAWDSAVIIWQARGN